MAPVTRFRSRYVNLLLAAVASALASCGTDVGITCAAGAECHYSDGVISITIPALAVPAAGLDLHATKVTNPPDSATIVPGTTWDVIPSGLVLSPPATLTFTIPAESIAIIAGVKTSELAIYRRGGSAWRHISGQTVSVDASSNVTISAPIDTLGLFTVRGAPAASVTVSPSPDTVAVGASVQLTAAVFDSSANQLPLRAVQWSSSAPSVASVNLAGLVTGVAAGSATISARSGDAVGTATVVVRLGAGPPASVTITPPTTFIAAGAQVQLTGTIRDANGLVVGGTLTWSSTSPSIASVDQTGRVSGVAVGTDTIKAQTGSIVGVAVVTVGTAGLHPNQPAGFTPLIDIDFSTKVLSPGSWAYSILWNDTARARIVQDTFSQALRPSAPNVLEVVYPIGFTDVTSPPSAGRTFASVRQVYVSYWLLVSNPWQYHNSSVNKLLFIGTDGSATLNNEMVLGLVGTTSANAQIGIGVQTPQNGAFPGSSTGGFYTANANANVHLPLGVWHHIEILMIQSTGGTQANNQGNGVARWWVDGTMVGNHTNVLFNATADSHFDGATLNPNWGGSSNSSKTERDFIRVDHFFVSGLP